MDKVSPVEVGESYYQINFQVLSLVTDICRKDPANAALMFGLSAELVDALSGCSPTQVELLSATQICVLTLKNSGNVDYWKKLIKESSKDSKVHKLNLLSLSIFSIDKNVLTLVNMSK